MLFRSGEDKIFPKDLPVGTVASTKSGRPFQTIQVEPAAHLDRLEEVLVLLTEHSLASTESTSPNSKPENASSAQENAKGQGKAPAQPVKKPAPPARPAPGNPPKGQQ